MSLQATVPVEVSALVSLRVPRGEAGTLERGVRDVLANVDGVSAVRIEGVTGVRPTWSDIRVDADVALTVQVPAEESDESASAVARLGDGFGVTDVSRLDVCGTA